MFKKHNYKSLEQKKECCVTILCKSHIAVLIFISIQIGVYGQQVLNWKFKHPIFQTWIEADTHGSVQEKLIQIGELPDPFFGMNEKLFRWIENHQWEFISDFSITLEDINNDYVEIQFPGIDTYAELFLNGVRIGFAQNAFRPYHFEVKKNLKLGENQLRVIFYPPVLYHKDKYLKAGYKLPAPNDVDSIAIAPYTRKPQYQFGWDWSIRMNTIGLLKPVSVVSYNENRISSTNIVVDSVRDGKAYLTYELRLKHPAKQGLVWKSVLFDNTEIERGEHIIVRSEIIEEPKLWWPRGQGEQSLYKDEWTLLSGNSILDLKKISFGVRTSKLIVAPDKWGTSYVINVNGREIFCKGGDYIPQDIFPSRVKDEEIRSMIGQMSNSNYNMVRVWGGGYYPDDIFYETCDSLGIMIWQDFMFACAMYPGDPDFLENVKEELEFQIPRISSHPSLILFNGNNEVDVAWKNWGFQGKYNLFGEKAKEIEESYNRLFKQLIPVSVARHTNTPYIHTSPLSNWGKDEFYNHGSQHYWGVWHGKDPMSDFAKKIGRFNAEYGFQSFPEYSTLLTFSDKKDWNLESEVMKHHQKSYVGNGMILKHARLLFGEPVDFEEFVYFSQLTQASAIRMAVTGHRLDAPRCMGTLYWQVNDCWPAPSWSSIDYFGNWKALQYWVKDDYEDVTILSKRSSGGTEEYFLISDQPDTFQLNLRYTIFNLKGKEMLSGQFQKSISGFASEKICQTCICKKLVNRNYVIQFEWNDAKGLTHDRTFSHLPETREKPKKSEIKLELIDVNPNSKTAKVVLTNTKYLRNVWIHSSVAGVHLNKNFLDLLPGIHVYQMKFKNIPSIEELGVKWM
jgi:beta-mannosidase